MRGKKDFSRELLEEAERIDREEIAITDEEAEGRWVFVRPRPPKEPSQIYSLRLPASVVEKVRLLAASKGEPPTVLLREWVLEHLEQELEELEERGKAKPRRATARRGQGRTSASRLAADRKKTSAAAKSADTSPGATSSKGR